jgi:hypothetical protein
MTPIEILNLPIRPYNVLKRNKINYVEQIIQIGVNGLVAFNQMSMTSAELILSVANEVLDFPKGSNILEEASVTNNEAKSTTPINLLRLSPKSFNILKRNKIIFVEQITELGVKGLASETGISESIARKIFYLARELLPDTTNVEFEAIQESVDSFDQRLNDKKKILPEHLEDFLSPENKIWLPKLLLSLIKEILLFENRERSYEVLSRRFGLEGNNVYTLDEIGLYYGLTRERVRQMEDKAIKFLRGSLVLTDFRRKAHRIDGRVITEIENFIKVIKSSRNSVLPENILFNIIQEQYDIVLDSRLAAYYRLLLEICGFRRLSGRPTVQFKSARSGWIVEESKGEKFDEVWIAFDAVYKVLRETGVSIDLFDLIIEVNRPRKKKRINNWAIETAIILCEDIECLNDNRYQLKLHKLNRSQQVFRIFVNGPRQVRNAKDICKEINLELARLDASSWDLQTMTNALVADERFVPAGRKGWVLKEWNEVASESSIDVIHKFFNKLGKPASAKEICEDISRTRKFKEKTIYQYLQDKTNFVRVGPGLYQPVNWPVTEEHQKQQTKGYSKEDIAGILENIFTEVGQSSLLMSELVRKLSTRTGLKINTAYKYIYESPAVRFESDKEDSRRKIAHFIPLGQRQIKLQSSKKVKSRVTLRIRIREFVIQYLSNMSLRSVELSKLVQQAMRELKCQKPTFYYYLSEMEDVVKTKMETGEIVCTLIKKKSAITFPELDTIANMSVKAEVKRAISLLSLETVDFCLFHLGKIFEHTVTEYVDLASAKKVISATDHDKRNLANRLDCLTREGIITNKRTVDYLRHERNARAHELGERQAMMREAPELARLYVKNIADLQEKIEGLK